METSLEPAIIHSLTLITEDQIETLIRYDIVVGILSFVGSLFNLVFVFLTKSGKEIKIMVFFLGIMDLLVSITIFYLPVKFTSNFWCQVVSFTRHFGFSGSFLWTDCFAYALYSLVVKGRDIGQYIKSYIAIATTGAFLNGSLAVLRAYTQISPTGHCMHLGSKSDFLTKLLVNDILGVASFVFCILCYISVVKRLRVLGSPAKLNLTMLTYPLILLLCLGPKLIREVIEQFGGPLPIGFLYISNMLFASQGFWNALAYGLSGNLVKMCRKNGSKQKENTSSDVSYMSLKSIANQA